MTSKTSTEKTPTNVIGKVLFYGKYDPVDKQGAGLVTVGQAEDAFPPNIMYKGKRFVYAESIQVPDTPGNKVKFLDYCKTLNVDTEVAI